MSSTLHFKDIRNRLESQSLRLERAREGWATGNRTGSKGTPLARPGPGKRKREQVSASASLEGKTSAESGVGRGGAQDDRSNY